MPTRFSSSFLLLVLVQSALAQVLPGRFVVTLSADAAAVVESRAKQAGAAQARAAGDLQRSAISQQQRAFAQALSARTARVVSATDTVLNTVTVELSGDDAAAWLRGLPGVVRVSPDKMYWAKLDRVLALSNVPKAWEQIGGADKAGAGIKIAILDTGIDTPHPGFKDDSLAMPEGFPRFTSDANKALATNKVIVVRSYEDMAGEGYGAGLDKNGHGTQAACAAACVVHETRIGMIGGVAPKAYLGQYKVLGDAGGGANSLILKGIDDAVKDGMDVLNLSLGSDITEDPANDEMVKAVNAASAAGAIVLVAAGNAGPDENTINSPGTAEDVLTVGSSSNDRAFGENGKREIDPNRLSEFSSRGPNLGPGLKPDLVATGDNFYTAQTRLKEEGIFYTITQGTSFATPAVAGGAAVVKAARPGLTAAQYRSLVMHSASGIVMVMDGGTPAPIRHQGAGRMNLENALNLPVAITPAALKFGLREQNADVTRTLTITNVTADAVTVSIRVESFDKREAPVLAGPAEFSLAAGASQSIDVKMTVPGASGEYQGVVLIANSKNSVVARVPYWMGSAGGSAASITLLEAKSSGKAGELLVMGVRVIDRAGLTVPQAVLEVKGLTPGASGKAEASEGNPGQFLIGLVPAPGENIFELVSGGVSRQITIMAE